MRLLSRVSSKGASPGSSSKQITRNLLQQKEVELDPRDSAGQTMNLRDLARDGVERVPVKPPPAPLLPRAKPAEPPAVERYLFPKDGDYRFTQKVLPAAIAKVDAIRNQALALGWSESRLYQNRGQFRFPCGPHYGLVCFISEEHRIGELTAQSIEIIGPPPLENRLRFYNPDVAQPWVTRRLSPSAQGKGLFPVTETN